MFRYKICGITSVDDARMAIDLGADALGLNFHQDSPRCVSIDDAQTIAQELGDSACLVGVFVNDSDERIRRITDSVGLQAIQLHGDEPVQFARQLDRAVIKAIRANDSGLALANEYLMAAAEGVDFLTAFLVDAAVAGQAGGTGQRADWRFARQLVQTCAPWPVILAGGLSADNVADAITQVQPAAVDVASGVEISPGRKSLAAMRAFIQAARCQFERMERSPPEPS